MDKRVIFQADDDVEPGLTSSTGATRSARLAVALTETDDLSPLGSAEGKYGRTLSVAPGPTLTWPIVLVVPTLKIRTPQVATGQSAGGVEEPLQAEVSPG